MFLVCLPLSYLSFYSLRIKNLDLSTIGILFEMHASNLIASYTTNCPLVGVYGCMIYPFFIFSLTSSMRIHLLNAFICGVEFYLSAERVLMIFQVTLTDEQYRQITTQLTTGLFCVITAIGVSMVQKSVESNIWKLAQENYLKSENLTKEVVQAMEAKDTFVSMLSHEIRNPLNSLKGSIDFLLQAVKDFECLQVLRNAKMSGDILLNLVSNVLDAAKLKSDKMEIACTETDFVDVMKKVHSINSEKFKEKELSVQSYIDESVPRLLWIDPSRMLQILMNLFSNAVKFTHKKGKINMYVSWCSIHNEKANLLLPFRNIGDDKVPEIRPYSKTLGLERSGVNSLQRGMSEAFEEFNVDEENNHKKKIHSIVRSLNKGSNDLSTLSFSNWDTAGDSWSLHKTPYLHEEDLAETSNTNAENPESQNKGYLKIQITDTGCGIEESDLSKMFGMFEQASHGQRSVHGGTGLGLWICKQLCHKMKGDITVYSKHGEGTSFVLYIPVDNNRVNTAAVRSGLARERIRALVVDDYSVNRYLHKLLLEQEGVQVSVACNGKEAVEKYKAHLNDPYDFIMMDVQMPVMDGFVATKLIREWEADNNKNKVDIYFVTGEYFNEEEVMAGFKHRGGLNEQIRCLRKPLGGEMIHRMVTQYKSQPLDISQ